MAMEAYGEVVALRERGRAVVRTRRHSSCSKCGACGLSGELPDLEVETLNLINAQPGDIVIVSMESRNVLEAALLVYMVPLLVFIGGMLLGRYAGARLFPELRSEWLSVAVGVLLMAVSYFLLSSYDRRASRQGKYMPHITGFAGE